ncbi:MAG: Lactate utilization protein A [Alphaproteobacteria bacterium MarineAlpha10_Bin1]|nr:MAG: Lactate utilization protein A [Alphaproteobacteria bacterium MarineAlpha10_Bin1]
MQTQFNITQLANSHIAEAERVLRKCVHCGFCLATCPTYVLLGDERDSPRGRIYMIKGMLEGGGAADKATVRHVDRCLSCLSCMTTCPSGVDYMHLVDHARSHIAETYQRPLFERLIRRMLAVLLPRPNLFRLAVIAARGPGLVGQFLPGSLGALMRLSFRPVYAPSWVDRPQIIAAQGASRRKRVALLNGCVQKALAPQINEATVRLLSRHGCEVVVVKGAGCCGALSLHQGERAAAETWARANIEAFSAQHRQAPLDAVVSNASGCGTMVKDYGGLFRDNPDLAESAAEIAGKARDITEVMAELGPLNTIGLGKLRVAYHGACSLQHGQKLHEGPKALLTEAGFDVCEAAEGHLCCGSAGTYNILQPDLARRMLERKAEMLEQTEPDIIATGNIGCMTQIASGTHIPVVHTAELLDWATGGPIPPALAGRSLAT